MNNTLSTIFGSLTALLVPFVGHPIYKVTSMVASLGEIEGWQWAKGIRCVKTPKGAWTGRGPNWVMRMQTGADLLAAEVDRNKMGR